MVQSSSQRSDKKIIIINTLRGSWEVNHPGNIKERIDEK